MIFATRALLNVFIYGGILYASKHEKRLIRHLFVDQDYDNAVRPVLNDDDPVNVTFNIALFQLIDINEKAQTIEVSAWIRQKWTDIQLQWNPADYNGIKEFNVPPDRVWLPDIVLYNNVNDDIEFGGNIDKLNTRVIVYNTGDIYWFAPVILKANCKILVKDFPFDTQHCHLQFGSWTYDLARLDIMGSDVDVAKYMENSEWHLAKTEAVRTEVKYTCCPTKYPDMTFHLYFSRRSLFYIMNLILPIVLISFLTSLAFILPSESGERISLAVTLMLAVTVFMLLVAETTPATSDATPLVTVYFIISLITVTLTVVALACISRLYHRKKIDGEMGAWTRKVILDTLSYVMRIRTRIDNRISCMEAIDDTGSKDSICHDESLPAKEKTMIDTKPNVNVDDESLFQLEWHIVAKTLDRCLFIVFILVIFLSVVICFSSTTFVT